MPMDVGGLNEINNGGVFITFKVLHRKKYIL